MSGAPISAGEEPRWIAVGAVGRFVPGRLHRVWIAGVDLIVVRDDAGLSACERACPHEQADLSLGHVAGGRIYCPRHLASFDLCDGAISAGWSCRNLRIYAVKIKDGKVWVDVGEPYVEQR